MYRENTILLLVIILICLVLLYKYANIEGFGFYQNYFPPCNDINKPKQYIQPTISVVSNSPNIFFEYPLGTPKEIMIRQVANMFKSKGNTKFSNIIDIKIERKGVVSSEHISLDSLNFAAENVYLLISIIKTRPKRIGVPQVNHKIRIPLEFTSKGVMVKIDMAEGHKNIDYFLHHYFDLFYCRGKYERKIDVVGKDASNYAFVSRADKFMDCQWGDNKGCKIYPHIVDIARQIPVEPDSDSIVRNYVTPASSIDTKKINKKYIKRWDGRGVTIEPEQSNIKLSQYINHPSLFQNKLDGLYDDLFDMSRNIPSFPTGHSTH